MSIIRTIWRCLVFLFYSIIIWFQHVFKWAKNPYRFWPEEANYRVTVIERDLEPVIRGLPSSEHVLYFEEYRQFLDWERTYTKSLISVQQWRTVQWVVEKRDDPSFSGFNSI